MYITVYLLLLAPAALAVAAPAVARHLAPAAAVRVLSCLAVIATAATLWALCVLVVGGLGREYADEGSAALRVADPVPRSVGVLAAVLLTVAVARAVVVRRQRVAGARLLSAVRLAPAAGELVVLADDRPDAFALPGRPGRIVVTSGMLGALSAGERAVLLAHERAHLRHGHHHYAALADYAAAVNPVLGPLRDLLNYGLERWADEEAAAAVNSRALAAISLARAALATSCRAGRPAGLAYVRHRIGARVEALRAQARPSRGRRLWVVAVLAGGTVAALVDTVGALARCVNAMVL
ncbi:M56 family metallopeptidase [Kitasatospora sp. NPDC002227]|uniref:M56 family metallopeptidase n=1 Tax=Kitasatospora sp. NPDC002227 TaxID=3154773 RepID=UPI00332270A5